MNYKDYHNYQNTSTNEYSNSDFTKLSNAISANVEKISQNGTKNVLQFEFILILIFIIVVNSMQKIVNQLGTSSDTEQLRQQL